jgi:hypothetical protein
MMPTKTIWEVYETTYQSGRERVSLAEIAGYAERR